MEIGSDLTVPSLGGGAVSVSILTQHLAGIIRYDEVLQDIWVRGEISNCTRAASGHLYFSMKDDQACLGCVMWRSSAGRLRFRPEPGMQVLAHGRISVYAARGQYQLDVDDLQPDGAGALFLAFEQVKARLLSEGLFELDRKRPLPAFPTTVAVVTSLSGAAVRDICAILGSDPNPPRVVLVPAQVQGEGAEESICAALELANRSSGADVIIVGRGGGAIEDLWCFNSEAVARAIAGSALPVISAVGHETDVTLADLVADVRAPTPTAAASLVVDSRRDVLDRWERASAQVAALVQSRLETERLRWEGLRRRMPLARPEWLVATRRQRLDELNARLARAREALFSEHRHRLALAVGKLEGLSPLATLARGYARVSRTENDTPITSAQAVRPGDTLRIHFHDGDVEATVVREEPRT